MTNILKDLVETNTIADKENQKIRGYIKGLLKDKGFEWSKKRKSVNC